MDQSLATRADLAPSTQKVIDTFLKTFTSAETRRAYRKPVETAVQELGDLQSITPVALVEYKDRVLSRLTDKEHPLSPASVARKLDALRSFLKFARLTGQCSLSIEVIRFTLKSPPATVIRPYQVLTEKEMGHLLAGARDNPRNRVLLALTYSTGLRAAEVCNLRVGDISQDEQGMVIRVRQGKGLKDRVVPVEDLASSLLLSYLQIKKIDLSTKSDRARYVFESRKGKGRGKLTTSRLRQIVADYLKKSRIRKPVSMHSLRHSAAIRWIKRGAPVPMVQKLLGHARLDTTQRYAAHFEMPELREIVNRAQK